MNYKKIFALYIILNIIPTRAAESITIRDYMVSALQNISESKALVSMGNSGIAVTLQLSKPMMEKLPETILSLKNYQPYPPLSWILNTDPFNQNHMLLWKLGIGFTFVGSLYLTYKIMYGIIYRAARDGARDAQGTKRSS